MNLKPRVWIDGVEISHLVKFVAVNPERPIERTPQAEVDRVVRQMLDGGMGSDPDDGLDLAAFEARIARQRCKAGELDACAEYQEAAKALLDEVGSFLHEDSEREAEQQRLWRAIVDINTELLDAGHRQEEAGGAKEWNRRQPIEAAVRYGRQLGGCVVDAYRDVDGSEWVPLDQARDALRRAVEGATVLDEAREIAAQCGWPGRHFDLCGIAANQAEAAEVFGSAGDEPYTFEEVHLVLGNRCVGFALTEPQIAKLLAAGGKPC